MLESVFLPESRSSFAVEMQRTGEMQLIAKWTMRSKNVHTPRVDFKSPAMSLDLKHHRPRKGSEETSCRETCVYIFISEVNTEIWHGM